MSEYCSKMALLDDTNGNTVSLNKQVPGDGLTGDGGEGEDDGMAPTTADSLLHSPSNDDLSQSLSEYTDADESISAPTELLAEFLSAIMIRDYVNALKYCKQILQYEPNNTTARDFYPHILSKISEMQSNELSGESDENYNFNASSPLASSPSSYCSSSGSSPPTSFHSSCSSASCSVAGTSSSSGCDNIDEVIMVCSSDSDDSSESCCSLPNVPGKLQSTGGRQGPVDEPGGRGNGSRSASDNNTSRSYSSLLLEEEEKDLTLSDISNLNIEEDETSNDCGGSQENSHRPADATLPTAKPVPSGTNLGSASVFASRLVAMLRSKVIPAKAAAGE